jgi:heme O synthase-like polyprenyltransferase
MERNAAQQITTWGSITQAITDFGLLVKFKLTLMVLFSALFNPLTGFLGMLSLISYAFIYTPLKRSTPLAVVVGAVPGALPLVIGCTALGRRNDDYGVDVVHDTVLVAVSAFLGGGLAGR